MLLSKEILKNSMKGLKITGCISISSLLMAGGILHTHLYATTAIPVDYNVSSLTSTLYREAPAGYVKPDYQIDLKRAPSVQEAGTLSYTEVAEIISQEYYRFFKTDLSGETIHLTYGEGRHGLKSSWYADIDKNDKHPEIKMNIDSVTGEVNEITSHTYLPTKDPNVLDTMSAKYDAEIKKDLKGSCKKVQELITASNWLPEKIKSVTYDRTTGFLIGTDGDYTKPVSYTMSCRFIVTTESNASYKFYISTDLTKMESVYSAGYIVELDQAIQRAKEEMDTSAN